MFELKWKVLKNKGQAKEGYLFIEFLEIYFGKVTSEYSYDNEIVQGVIKTNTEKTLRDEE